MRTLSILLILMFAWTVVANSQPVPPTPKIEASSDQTKVSSGNAAPAQPAPITVSTDGPTEYLTICGYKGRITDWLIALFTLCLAIVSGFQGWFLWGTLKATDKAANAARDAANSLPVLEKSYVFAFVEPGGLVMSPAKNRLRVDFRNHGRTPAMVKSIRCEAGMWQTYPARGGSDLNLVTYPEVEGQIISVRVGTPDEETFWITIAPFDISPESLENINTGRKKFLCIGIVEYEDVFGSNRKTGWCWEYFPKEATFRVSDNNELNYRT